MKRIIVAHTQSGFISTNLYDELKLEDLQAIVDGYIERTTIAELEPYQISLIVNEEGLLRGLDPNENLYPFFFVGNVAFVDSSGEAFDGLDELQESIVRKFLAGLEVIR